MTFIPGQNRASRVINDSNVPGSNVALALDEVRQATYSDQIIGISESRTVEAGQQMVVVGVLTVLGTLNVLGNVTVL